MPLRLVFGKSFGHHLQVVAEPLSKGESLVDQGGPGSSTCLVRPSSSVLMHACQEEDEDEAACRPGMTSVPQMDVAQMIDPGTPCFQWRVDWEPVA